MKKEALIISLALIFMVGLLRAAPEKTTFQAAKTQAIELHRSLIGFAAPTVKARITASAKAARSYLAKCGASCDLEAFLSKDLKKRFFRVSAEELHLLEALAFGETFKDMSQMDQLNLEEAMQKQAQIMQLMSNISKTTHDTAKGIIQNMR